MSLQFISDSTGKTTGVYIPIQEWNELKEKFKGIDKEEIDVPQWHKDIVLDRIVEYKKHPEQAMDFDSAMNDIEQSL